MSTRGAILVADDDPLFRRTVVRLLEGQGYEVSQADDASAAIALLAVDVVVLDSQGKILHCNKYMERLCGRSLDEMRGRAWVAEFLLDVPAIEAEIFEARVDYIRVRNGAPRLIRWRERELLRREPDVRVMVGVDVTPDEAVNSLLRASLREKDALLHGFHHRAKNDLQLVASLVYLQGIGAPEEVRVALEECRKRISSIALVHEHLHLSGELSRIEMRHLLTELGNRLCPASRGTATPTICVSGGGLVLDIGQAIPVAIVVNELLTNAQKHAYAGPTHAGAGSVRIRVGANHVTVEDDGVGLPPDFDETTGHTLGLKLIRSLARQLDAQLEFTSANGVSVCLRLPDSR